MPRPKAALPLLLVLLLPSAGTADEVRDLYVAEVPVTSQDPGEFRRAVRQGMTDVLIRVSGNLQVASDSTIRRALDAPDRYYYQFSYESRPIEPEAVPGGTPSLPRAPSTAASQPMTGVEAGQSERRFLRIHFEPSAIARLLRDSGLPVWGAVRPNVLVWLVVETDEGRTILTEEVEHGAGEALERRARLRGLPVLLPLLDLEDKARISVTTLWGAFHDDIERASSRYRADSILAGRVYQGLDGEWMAHWSYRLEEGWSDFDNAHLRLESLVSDAVDRVADRLAARYSISSSRGSVWVEVEAVDTLEDYVQVSAYLESLAPVQEMGVERVSGSDVLFRLGTEGTTEQMVQLIALDRKLFLLSQGKRGAEPLLYFRWLE